MLCHIGREGSIDLIRRGLSLKQTGQATTALRCERLWFIPLGKNGKSPATVHRSTRSEWKLAIHRLGLETRTENAFWKLGNDGQDRKLTPNYWEEFDSPDRKKQRAGGGRVGGVGLSGNDGL